MSGRRTGGGLWRLGVAGAVAGGLCALGVVLGQSGVVLSVVGLVVMVVVHEAAHYLMARRSKMAVTDAGLGFGPALFSATRGGVRWRVNLLPLGAYVRIPGMYRGQKTAVPEEATFRAQSALQRFCVVVAGGVANVVLAVVLMFAGLLGAPAPAAGVVVAKVDAQVAGLRSPAEAAGIGPGERIAALDGVAVSSVAQLHRVEVAMAEGSAAARRHVEVVVVGASGRRRALGVEAVRHDGAFEIGVLAQPATRTTGPFQAAWQAVDRNYQGLFLMGGALGRLFQPSFVAHYVAEVEGRPVPASVRLERPVSVVGVVEVGSEASRLGWRESLRFMALVSMALGVTNLLPVLPLDGGHALVVVYERLRSRRGRRHFVSSRTLGALSAIGASAFLALAASAIWLDVFHPVHL